MTNNTEPGLFAQPRGKSSRDYSKEKYWGKNQFNSSFPASLVAYMSALRLDPIYLKINAGEIVHDKISASRLLGIDPLSEDAFFNYETGYPAYETYYVGDREKIDLVMMDKTIHSELTGLEIKLTALPDSTTKKYTEDKYGCEMVMRPPTICFLACSICHYYKGDKGRNQLKDILGDIPQINHWEEIESVLPHYDLILNSVLNVCANLERHQTPLVIQPVWKTPGGKPVLADNCLDVFVWSNLSIIKLCAAQKKEKKTISRFMRTIIWIYRMLFEYCVYGQFDYSRIVRLHSYNLGNDKAFAVSGTQSWPFMHCDELTRPRIRKDEIKNIILGGGQNLLSPERRFDAVIVNSPNLFD